MFTYVRVAAFTNSPGTPKLELYVRGYLGRSLTDAFVAAFNAGRLMPSLRGSVNIKPSQKCCCGRFLTIVVTFRPEKRYPGTFYVMSVVECGVGVCFRVFCPRLRDILSFLATALLCLFVSTSCNPL